MPLRNPNPGASVAAAIAADRPTVGEYVPDRSLGIITAPTVASGTVTFNYFTAAQTEVVSTITAWTSATQAAATPTVCRMGVFSVAANGDLTPVGVTPNDTTLFLTANTAYAKNLSASFTKVAGQR